MRRIKNWVNGVWTEPATTEYCDVINPSTGETLAEVPMSTSTDTESAIDAAVKAFPSWSATPVSRRAAFMFDLRDLVIKEEEEISTILVQEMGKSLPDARAEMKRMIENIEVSCGMPTIQQGSKLIGGAQDIDGEILRLPIGVFGLIAPFNFPAMVPFWFIPYALASGNTYVAKPSEQVPLTMEKITRLMETIGLPPGVFNVVNGGREVGETLIQHPRVAGVSMVGSSKVAHHVAENCARTGKRYHAMGGAKNHLVVMPDADFDNTIRNMITSCFGCAGQRCMAASAIVCVGKATYDEICSRFVDAAKDIIVADPLDPAVADEPMVMGPVISKVAKERILGCIEQGVREGATLSLDGRNLTIPGRDGGFYIGPTVLTNVQPGMSVHDTEIFGPVVVILEAADLDEAIGIVNGHRYGNGASIYTSSGHSARKFKLETQSGMIGINIGIPAPVASLPFGGMKDSMLSPIKAQAKSVVQFFTEEKVITERYWE